MQTQTIIFVGPQGSGKGTQVKNITTHLEKETERPVLNIETGKAFRDLSDRGGYTANRVKELLAEGKMIPDFLTTAFVVKFLVGHLEPDTHLTMDGVPRNMEQVAFIDELMEFYKRPLLTVVFLDTPEDIVRTRMAGRQRKDDTPDLIDERLRLYKQNTLPIVEHYRGRDDVNFIRADGRKSINDVQQEIIQSLVT